MLRLMVKDSAGNLFEYPLDFDELTVGRDDSCDVILDAPNVSRKHARFFFDQEGFLFVEDMDSSTGTIVDGEAITEPTAIDENSKVLVGSFILFLDFAEDQDSEEFYEFETDSADEAARLVVLNGPDRGAEYPLTADFIPIGKAGTNAIVLDHPSLSPEHAQIIREGDAYVLQDLASSSGTRVNGKEIEEVALRDGDLIQLGSLKLRFMYDREVTRRRSVAKLARELKQRWKVLVPGLAVVFLLLILIVTIASPGGEAGSNDSETGLEQPPEEVESALVKAKNMLSEGKFDKAEALIQKVLEQDPLNDTASKLKQRLEQERKNEKLYNEASMLFDLGRKKEAREAFEKIPTNSRFYKLAKPKIDELNEHLSRIFFEQGRRAYRRGRYRVAHDLLVKYLEIKPDSPHAIEWVKDCEKNLKKKGVKFEPYIPP